jgi:AAA+ ATPase superfamily predicted ATPase
MKFYDREAELNELRAVRRQTTGGSRMVVLTGRRRVGKTALAMELVHGQRFLYLFVAKKSEPLLCAEWVREVRAAFPDAALGEVQTFSELFAHLLLLARSRRFTLIIDEFQEFLHVNSSVYSDVQRLWDRERGRTHMTLLLIGSVYSLMHRIFENAHEPLFGRADRILALRPLPVAVLRDILRDHRCFTAEALFALYAVTGGMPRYVELLAENAALRPTEVFSFILRPHSPFLDEGRNLLVEEFGRDHGTYFSILELIAAGRTGRGELESVLQVNVGGYLDRLEKDYGLVNRVRPIAAERGARYQKYSLSDHFLRFWFRFIHRHWSLVQMGNFDHLRVLLDRDWPTYSGVVLEHLFRDLAAASGRYARVGAWWERGNRNEIDLVAVDDERKRLLLGEVKRSRARVDLAALEAKAHRLLPRFPGYEPEYVGLSLADIARFLP